MSAQFAAQYTHDVRETDPIYAAEGLCHPGLLPRLFNWALVHNVVLGPWIHVGSRVEHFAPVRIGDQLRIVRDRERHDVAVVGIPTRRGPAPEARLCYSESEESIAARQHARELARLSTPGPSSRPDKRDRRRLVRFQRGED